MRPGDGGVAEAVSDKNERVASFFQGRATALQNSCARPCSGVMVRVLGY